MSIKAQDVCEHGNPMMFLCSLCALKEVAMNPPNEADTPKPITNDEFVLGGPALALHRCLQWEAWYAASLKQPAEPSGEAVELSVSDKHCLKLAEDRCFNEDHDGLSDDEVDDICWALWRSGQRDAARDALVREECARVADAVAAKHREVGDDDFAEQADHIAGTIRSTTPPTPEEGTGCHGLDTPEMVRFYEHDFYVLSNFSAFRIRFNGINFPTSEEAYHYQRFSGFGDHHVALSKCTSAHDAFRYAQDHKADQRKDWDDVKVNIMRYILFAKAEQHEYVRRKLLATGDRLLVEDSWRDDFWGWGPNRDGKNMLGKLWMDVRAELRATPPPPAQEGG